MPSADDEEVPDFRAPSATAREEAFAWIMLSAIPASLTFVTAPVVAAATLAAGFTAAGIAVATHARRRNRR